MVIVRNERVDVSSRVVWMWRVMCGERRRGRDVCLEAVDWVVLLIFGEVFNKVMLTCTNMEGRALTPLSPSKHCTLVLVVLRLT